jgi:hypothetical protein
MDIPVIPVRAKGGNIVSADLVLGDPLTMTDDTVGYADLVSSLADICGKRTPILAVDVKGMQKKDIMPDVLKNMRTKHEIWLMTGIRNAGDVMDAFQGNASRLAVPYHFTTDRDLRDMAELSDSCMPALFADNGSVRMKGKKKDLRNIIREMERMNFAKVLVFDVSDCRVNDVWGPVSDLADIVIPYVRNGKDDADAVRDIGFQDVMVSGIKLFRDVSKRSEIRSCMLP